jgi:hypothetical protein
MFFTLLLSQLDISVLFFHIFDKNYDKNTTKLQYISASIGIEFYKCRLYT